MAQSTQEQLLEVIARKDRRIAQLEARVTQLETRIVELEQLLDKATRASKRQAAPFSKGPPKDKPSKPGRKAGDDYGPKAHRPLPEQTPDEIHDVPLPPACPDCGGPVREEHIDRQFQVEIPRKPLVRRFDVHVGQCTACGRRIRPRHALQTSQATGAAASQLGPDLQALIAIMKDKYGLSYGDIQGLLEDGFGISISRGGAAQIVQRAAQRSEPFYDRIGQIVRAGNTVYPDETGWKVGGWLQWLWVFVGQKVTYYVIRPNRGSDVWEEVLGRDYSGWMTHDGWAPYDGLEQAEHQQCVTHLLRRAQRLLERARRRAVRFPRAVQVFLLDALDLRDRRDVFSITRHGLRVAQGRLESRLKKLLDGKLSHEGNRKFRDHLARHADQILTFLYVWGLEASNWPAEQAIRPMVANRKVFGGNRTWAGAHAQEVLGSLFVTCAQQARDSLKLLSNLIRATPRQRAAYLRHFLPVPAG
jgi:transposase